MLLDDPCVRFCRIYESEIKSRREDKEEHMKPTGSSNRFWEQLATVHANCYTSKMTQDVRINMWTSGGQHVNQIATCVISTNSCQRSLPTHVFGWY
jgi:hypothetical protein